MVVLVFFLIIYVVFIELTAFKMKNFVIFLVCFLVCLECQGSAFVLLTTALLCLLYLSEIMGFLKNKNEAL